MVYQPIAYCIKMHFFLYFFVKIFGGIVDFLYLYCEMIEVRNPYEVRVTSFRKKRKFILVDKPLEVVNTETGEVTAATPLVGNSSYRDTSPFVKLYDPEVLVRLRQNETKVFSYILMNMDYSGSFRLVMKQCTDYTGLSQNTVYIALRRLKELDVIMKDEKSTYWVNPNIACKGSRDGMNLVFDDEKASGV